MSKAKGPTRQALRVEILGWVFFCCLFFPHGGFRAKQEPHPQKLKKTRWNTHHIWMVKIIFSSCFCQFPFWGMVRKIMPKSGRVKKNISNKPTVPRFHWSNHQIFEASTGLIAYNPSRRQLVVISIHPLQNKNKSQLVSSFPKRRCQNKNSILNYIHFNKFHRLKLLKIQKIQHFLKMPICRGSVQWKNDAMNLIST